MSASSRRSAAATSGTCGRRTRMPVPRTTWCTSKKGKPSTSADATEFMLRPARSGPIAWLSHDLRMIGWPGDRVDGNRRLELRLGPLTAAHLHDDGGIAGAGRNYFTAPPPPPQKACYESPAAVTHSSLLGTSTGPSGSPVTHSNPSRPRRERPRRPPGWPKPRARSQAKSVHNPRTSRPSTRQ